MPINAASEDIAVPLQISNAKQFLFKFTPNFMITAWYRLFRSELTLTQEKEINAFNQLIQELTFFCDPGQPLELLPIIAECWGIFRHEKINKTTYHFTSVLNFQALRADYQQRKTIGGKTYWNYPFTSAILDILLDAEALKVGVKQSLCKIFFSYVASIALNISTLIAEQDKSTAIYHLAKVIDVSIINEQCRRVFDEKAIRILGQLNSRIAEFTQSAHPMRDAEFIPKSLDLFFILQKELTSELFDIVLAVSEGGQKEALLSDYKKINKNIISSDSRNNQFSPCNPFKTLLREGAYLLMFLNDEGSNTHGFESLLTPNVKDLVQYIKLKNKSGLLYFFWHVVDKRAQKVVAIEETDIQCIKESASHLERLGYWLKFHLEMSHHASDLSLLLKEKGQAWIAQGHESKIIQGFIKYYHEKIIQFGKEMQMLKQFLSSRIASGKGNEHQVLKCLNLVASTALQLNEKAISPLLNIEERYLIVASHIEERREKFFKRLLKLFPNAFLEESAINSNLDSKSHIHIAAPRHIKTMPALLVDLWRLVDDYEQSSKQTLFLNFWDSLFYLEKSTHLSAFRTFHAEVLRMQHTCLAEERFLQFLNESLSSTNPLLSAWAKESARFFCGSKKKVEEKLTKLASKKEILNRDKIHFIRKKLNLSLVNPLAWSKRTYDKLLFTLVRKFYLPEETAIQYLQTISGVLLRNEYPEASFRASLDECLYQCFEKIQDYASLPKLRFYWMQISKGFMSLGANPCFWMESVMGIDKLELPADSGYGFYAVTSQTSMILSTLLHRTQLLGESYACMQGKFDELLDALTKFGERLAQCVAEDDTWWWKLAALLGIKKGTGARLERAALYWAVFRLIYTILNDTLLINEETQVWDETVRCRLESVEKANQLYQEAVPKKQLFRNQGFETWKCLMRAFHSAMENLHELAVLRCGQAKAERNVSAPPLGNVCDVGAIRRALTLRLEKLSEPTLLPAELEDTLDQIVSETGTIFNLPETTIRSVLTEVRSIRVSNHSLFRKKYDLESQPSLSLLPLSPIH